MIQPSHATSQLHQAPIQATFPVAAGTAVSSATCHTIRGEGRVAGLRITRLATLYDSVLMERRGQGKRRLRMAVLRHGHSKNGREPRASASVEHDGLFSVNLGWPEGRGDTSAVTPC